MPRKVQHPSAPHCAPAPQHRPFHNLPVSPNKRRRNGADDRQRLVDRRIVDVAVGDQPDRLPAPGAAPQARASQAPTSRPSRRAPVWPISTMTMLVSTSRGSARRGSMRVQAFGEAPGAAVIVGEPVDHALERDDAGRRHHAGLAHAAADHAAIGARAFDEGRRAAQHRAERRAQALADAEADAVAVARDLGGRHAERDRRVEDARAVDVHRNVLLGRQRAQLRHDSRAAGPRRRRCCAWSRRRPARSRACWR